MTWQLNFPDHHEVARKRAEEFQRLSVGERIAQLADMMAFGWALVESSPDRAAIESQMNAQEEVWRKSQADLFARHVR
jgi:hypothetical protein